MYRQSRNCKFQNFRNFCILEFNGDDLVAQAAVFFTGGFEATSVTMSFTLYELAKHPEIQDKLRNEILDALDESDGKVTYDMVYINNVSFIFLLFKCYFLLI